MRPIKRLGVPALLCLLTVGCGTAYRGEPYPEEQPGKTVEVEAYLYDAKIRRQGKPTSFRLQLFQTDSVVALSGRGYLGKGALKGRMTADSLKIYFPATNEYLCEPTHEVISSTACPEKLPALNLPRLLSNLPDEEYLGRAAIARDDSNRKRPRFTLTWLDCPWRLELTYDRRETGWRLSKVRFDNGDHVRFSAKRRVYKKSVQVKRSKFRLMVPPDATHITL